MRPCPVVSPYPTSENNTEELEKKHPSLFPACAVTRSMRKGHGTSNNGAPGTELPADVPGFESDIFNERFSLRDFFEGSMVQPFQETEGVLSNSESPITRDKLIDEQRQDTGLKTLIISLMNQNWKSILIDFT